jgi:uncharacterized membrane protein YcaP (DUF421 family)
MDSVLRGVIVYFILLVILRVSGRRTLGQMTTFDFVLLLIIAETTQQALLGEDFSLTNAGLLIVTLIGIDIGLSLLRERWPRLNGLIEGLPLILVEDGRPIKERVDQSRVGEEDILAAARESQGIERMEQIKYAVLEHNGGISIIPKEKGWPSSRSDDGPNPTSRLVPE